MAPKPSKSGLSGSARIMRMSGPAFAAAEKHGKRTDLKGPARSVVDVPPLTSTGLDLGDLFDAHVQGAATHKSGTKALHMLIQFPTELVNGEDPARMLDLARRFGESVFGDQAIFSDRVDRDEKSRHVVDLFLAPKYQKTTKRSSKLAISTTKHLKALAIKHGRPPTLRGQGQALQDAFAGFLRAEGYTKVQRGEPKVLPGVDRKEPEELEADRIADMQSTLLDALQVPSRTDLLFPDRYHQAQRQRLEEAAAPLLAEATKTAAERVRRIEAEKTTADAQKRAQEAVRGADGMVRDALATLRENFRRRMASLESQIEKLNRDLKQQTAEREQAQERATEAEKTAKRAEAAAVQHHSLAASIRKTLKEVLGDRFEAVRERINADWHQHPNHPNQANKRKLETAEEEEEAPRWGPGM